MLSHPLLAEAAETLFVPVAIKNNTEGDADAATRTRFEEPAWSNPAVRFLSAGEDELAPRLHDDWSAAALAERMVAALRRSERGLPAWLDLLAKEELARRAGLERAVFSQA